jgi:hypothetical protein
MVKAPGDRGSNLSMAVLAVMCSIQQRLSVNFAVSPTHNYLDIYRVVLRTDSGFVHSFLEMSVTMVWFLFHWVSSGNRALLMKQDSLI